MKIRLLALRQTLGGNVKPGQQDRWMEGKSQAKGLIRYTETDRVQIVWRTVPYIVGEDIDYQNVRAGDKSKDPIIIFKGTDAALIAYQIIPVGEGTARDIILDLIARKISLPEVL